MAEKQAAPYLSFPIYLHLKLQTYIQELISQAITFEERHVVIKNLIVCTKTANGAPVILLLFNAGPLDITWAKLNPGVTAIMECFFPAQSTGEALLRSLTMSEATAAPAGRLPATWPAYLSQAGISYALSA